MEELLDKGNCTVEELLAENDLCQEVKFNSGKLAKFFTQEKIERLLVYLLQMPSQDADHDRGHKFPFMANEVCQSDLNNFHEKFFKAPEPEEETPKDVENEEDNIMQKRAQPNKKRQLVDDDDEDDEVNVEE